MHTMKEIYYKISEVSELLSLEQYTLRYLEHSLKLKIKRDERGDRIYTDSDLDTLRLIISLKEKGLNTTAIKMALENLEQSSKESGISPARNMNLPEILEIAALAKTIVEQNEEILKKNEKLEKSIEKLENKLDKKDEERKKRIEELINLWKAEQERNKSWFTRLRGK